MKNDYIVRNVYRSFMIVCSMAMVSSTVEAIMQFIQIDGSTRLAIFISVMEVFAASLCCRMTSAGTMNNNKKLNRTNITKTSKKKPRSL